MNTLKWEELEPGLGYRITQMWQVGQAMVGQVVRFYPTKDGWERDVWLPDNLATVMKGRSFPVIVCPRF